MASNFDFLKKIDKNLFSIVEDGEKLFRDEYFNQSVVQFRIYAEKMAKSILNSNDKELTFDTVLNNLKDKATSQREQEFIEDLFFIKKEGNKCAHGEDATSISALEVIRRAFEAGINYAWAKTKDKETDSLIFDETLLITQKAKKTEALVDKYLKLAQNSDCELEKENLLNQKQGEFLSSVDKSVDENNIKDKNRISNPIQYKKQKKKKELTPKQQKIKEKIKEAKKNLKENINKEETRKKPAKKQDKKTKSTKKSKENNEEFLKALLFVLFVLLSVVLILKMII